MISHPLQHTLTRRAPTIIIRRTKIRRKEAQDIPKRHLKIMHLLHQLRLIKRNHIRMAPTMTCNLS
jgi:hypothetical protein